MPALEDRPVRVTVDEAESVVNEPAAAVDCPIEVLLIVPPVAVKVPTVKLLDTLDKVRAFE